MNARIVGLFFISTCLLTSGCASTSLMQLSRNEAVVSASAAPVCHTAGASSAASQGAAIATLKQGFQRFVIVGYGAEDNTHLVATGPTYATTTGTYDRVGNTI